VIKHPVASSLLIAFAIALCFAGYMLATTRNVDEKPFIIYFTLVLLPFGWFLLWIILSGIAWWQGLTEGGSPKQSADRDAEREPISREK
jgi:hypothetical protein